MMHGFIMNLIGHPDGVVQYYEKNNEARGMR